jgi:hypothetical protein
LSIALASHRHPATPAQPPLLPTESTNPDFVNGLLRKFASEKALNRLICLASNGSSEYLADSMLEAAPEKFGEYHGSVADSASRGIAAPPIERRSSHEGTVVKRR